MQNWKRSAKKSLVVWEHRTKSGLVITRRPDSPVYWVCKDGEAVQSTHTLSNAMEIAETV